MTKQQALINFHNEFSDYIQRGFTVKQAYEKIFGDDTYNNFVSEIYTLLRAKGSQ